MIARSIARTFPRSTPFPTFSTTSRRMKHHLMIGTWTESAAIYTVAFDDENLSLELVKKTSIPEDGAISWMTFDHAKKNIYGAAMKTFSSYTVNSPTDIVHHASLPIGGDPAAQRSDTNTRAIFVLAAQKPPYNIYGNPFYSHAGYGNIFSPTPSGAISTNIQNYPYDPHSGVHGMVFSPSEDYLYSADMHANKVWTHRKGPETGKLELVGFVDAPTEKAQPRWVAIHPSGAYLYALMESGNYLAVYVIDEKTHLPVFTKLTYPLMPPGLPANLYRGDVTFLSSSGKYLFASTRGKTPAQTGYITAFRLGPYGNIEKQLFIMPTPTSGGHSNAVSPCPWSDEWVALCDDEVGFVEMYRWKDEYLARVARLEVREKGFGMNAIWYD